MGEQQVQKQHPIPQHVLGVQFKLIGDLTFRQFAILGFFGLLAYATFSYQALNLLIRMPLAGIFLLIGVTFGLVPIQDQPLDRWLNYMIKTAFSPTRRIWRKTPESPEFLTVPTPKLARGVEEKVSPEEARQRLEKYLVSLREKGALSPVDLAEKQQLEFINLGIQEAGIASGPPPPPPTKPPPPRRPFPIRRSEEVDKPSLASIINYATEPVFKLQRGEKVTYATTIRNVKVGRRLRYAPQAEVVFAPAKERVIEPSLPEPPTITEPTAPPSPPKKEAPTEEKISPAPPPVKKPTKPTPPVGEKPSPPKEEEKKEMAPPKIPPKLEPKKAVPKPPLPSVDQPNLISGAVFDAKGTVIEGVVVAVKDQEGTIIRATKTDQLGQFSFSPIPKGSYQIEFPKAKRSFDIMKLELTGAVVPPLEVMAKA